MNSTMRLTLLAAALLLAGTAPAQRLKMSEIKPEQIKSVAVFKNANQLPGMTGVEFRETTAIDTAQLVVTYTLRYKAGDEERSSDYRLQIAPRHTRCYAVQNERADSARTAGGNASIYGAALPADEVYRDRAEQTLTVINRLPSIESQPLLSTYTEKAPRIEWRITGAVDSLAGYVCHEAAADFRGRTWHVWFTSELPFDVGPWKLSGTPGLILQAEDAEGDYRFELSGLVQQREAVLRHKRPMKKSTRAKLADLLEQYHAAPYRFVGSSDDSHLFVTQNAEGKIICLDETNWKIEYDPMERE